MCGHNKKWHVEKWMRIVFIGSVKCQLLLIEEQLVPTQKNEFICVPMLGKPLEL